VPEADLKRVFEKYVRLGTQTTGGEKSSGLGLNICKQLVELHGGEIGVFNVPEGGATFWFTLPGQPPTEAAV
jgi:signal transduction histidine kinase